MTQEVHFVALREKLVPFERKEVFALRADKKHLWLQKLCIAILKKLGCYWVDQTSTYTRVPIDGRTFMERLYKQRSELFRYFNGEARTLLVGAEDYRELMCSDEIFHAFEFRAAVATMRTIMNMEVKVIPWMRGIVVMP